MTKPLDGVSVVVTRAAHQAQELVDLLHEAGATTLSFPVIEIVDPEDKGVAIAKAFEHSKNYDWLIVTSVNTVERVAPYLPAFSGKIAAIGPGTADAIADAGGDVDLIPREYIAESLLEAFPGGDGRVLLPRAEVARNVLPDGLRERGWDVDVVTAYRTLAVAPAEELRTKVEAADVITFTASSTVRAFVDTGVVAPSIVACIGPVTADTANELGMTVDVAADEHTMEGLVQALWAEIDRRRWR